MAPTFGLAVLGSLVAGPALGWLMQHLMERIQHIPTAIILQFVGTFTVWLLAEHVGLSGVLTTVCFAMTLARTAPARTPARIRIPTNAVWATVIFALNIFAFIFIGLQVRPILADVPSPTLQQYLLVAAAVLATVIVVRIVWHMAFNAALRWRHRRFGFDPPRPMLRPTVGSGLVISWAGMRGIVTLAAALALPAGFPSRDLIVLTAFSVVLGTLLIHGLTLKGLLRALNLKGGDPVGARNAASRANACWRSCSPSCRLAPPPPATSSARTSRSASAAPFQPNGPPGSLRRHLQRGVWRRPASCPHGIARHAKGGDIGDDAFHNLENQLDWMEVSDPLRAANADEA